MNTSVKTTKPLLIGRFVIVLENQNVSYILKRSLQSRQLWLQIHPEKGLCVTMPRHYNQENITAYLTSKSRWILRHLNRLKNEFPFIEVNTETPQVPVCYQGNPIPSCGEDHKKSYCLLDGTVVDYNGVLSWLRQQAMEVIPARALQYKRIIGVNYTKISIRDQKTRWGSCSHKGNLNFNWRLIMAPEPVLDYVIIHELCHLKRMSHNKAFWNEVAKYCSEWRDQRCWLNKHSRELHHFHSSSV
jgi:predicted metal-dependent hydrolase